MTICFMYVDGPSSCLRHPGLCLSSIIAIMIGTILAAYVFVNTAGPVEFE